MIKSVRKSAGAKPKPCDAAGSKGSVKKIGAANNKSKGVIKIVKGSGATGVDSDTELFEAEIQEIPVLSNLGVNSTGRAILNGTSAIGDLSSSAAKNPELSFG